MQSSNLFSMEEIVGNGKTVTPGSYPVLFKNDCPVWVDMLKKTVNPVQWINPADRFTGLIVRTQPLIHVDKSCAIPRNGYNRFLDSFLL